LESKTSKLTVSSFELTSIVLETIDGFAYHQKTDVYKRTMWYSFDKNNQINMVGVPVDRVKEIIALNKQGKKVDKLVDEVKNEPKMGFHVVDAQESITRFDDANKFKKKKKHNNKNRPRPQGGQPNQAPKQN